MPKYGPEHPNWKGGRYIDSRGYVTVMVAPGQYRREHRVVMEQILGRPLEVGEHVHHRNGDKQDNRPENLEIHTNSEHIRQHWQEDPDWSHHAPRPMAQCHPDRPHHAKGLCRQCYMNEAQRRYVEAHYAEHRARQNERRRTDEVREKRREYKRRRYAELRAQGLTAAEIRRRG